MSLDAVERQGMPFLGEDAKVLTAPAAAAGDAAAPGAAAPGAIAGETAGTGGLTVPGAGDAAVPAAGLSSAIRQGGPDLADRIREARERTLSNDPAVVRRAPNPERMRR